MKHKMYLLTVIAMGLAVAFSALAEVPRLINYQGILTDLQGDPLDGTYDLTFRIYPDSIAPPGLFTWTEVHTGVTITDGLFNVILGRHTPLWQGLFAYEERWLGITVGTEHEIAPRTRITSVPWALRAAIADSATSAGTGSDGDWTIDGVDMYSAVSGRIGIGATTLRGKVSIRSETDNGLHSFTLDGYGVYGAGSEAGVKGLSTSSYGVVGESQLQGVYGIRSTTNVFGYLGGEYGAYGEASNGNFGGLGDNDYGVYGEDVSTGNFGSLGNQGCGVYGQSLNGNAIYGFGENFGGVTGFTINGYGVHGVHSSSGNTGTLGRDDCGAYGTSSAGAGVYGYSPSGDGVLGHSTSGNAGRFLGNVLVEGGRVITPILEITGGSDLSEQFDIHGSATGQHPEPGMVVCVDPERPGDLMVSSQAYDKKVAGVISGAGGVKPGMLMGQTGSQADGANPVALTGRVYCWADASNGPIEPGDLLTTSLKPGHAMKATDRDRSHGAIIGKAMSSLAEGTGLALVLVNLQ